MHQTSLKVHESSMSAIMPRFLITEERCWHWMFGLNFPRGFHCSHCRGKAYYRIKRSQKVQCKDCDHQYSLRSKTMMKNSKLSFQTWFMALYFLYKTDYGMSSRVLSQELGVHVKTAHRLKSCILSSLEKPGETQQYLRYIQLF